MNFLYVFCFNIILLYGFTLWKCLIFIKLKNNKCVINNTFFAEQIRMLNIHCIYLLLLSVSVNIPLIHLYIIICIGLHNIRILIKWYTECGRNRSRVLIEISVRNLLLIGTRQHVREGEAGGHSSKSISSQEDSIIMLSYNPVIKS